MTRTLASAALVLLLAACVPAPNTVPPPVVVAQPTSAPTPSPAPPQIVMLQLPVQPDWTSTPLTPGDWTWRTVGQTSVAEFHLGGRVASAAVACMTAQRQVMIGVLGGDAGTMTVRTESLTRSAQSQLDGPFNHIILAADDPLLDAIAFSRGRFAVEVDETGYYLPSYPEITRVIEDCR